MKYLMKFEGFDPYDNEPLTNAERQFGKQTRLEKQFSKIVVDGLTSDDDDVANYWSTFTALDSEIKDIIGSEDIIYKELQNRIIENENPTDVMNDVCSKLEKSTKELQRLLNKLNSF